MFFFIRQCQWGWSCWSCFTVYAHILINILILWTFWSIFVYSSQRNSQKQTKRQFFQLFVYILKPAMATAACKPRPFVYPQRSSEHSKQLHRQKQIKDHPETLFADYDRSTMTNLLFYTENSSLWHTAFCQPFTFTTKRGICKGRQILVFEDAEGNEESRILSLNLYHNGTVMIQGSEPALQAFTADFIQIKQQAHLNTSLIRDHKDINTTSSPVKYIQKKKTTATALIQSPMSKMKEKFSLLEIDVVELK